MEILAKADRVDFLEFLVANLLSENTSDSLGTQCAYSDWTHTG